MVERTGIRSRTEIESEISRAIIRFEKEYMGRGPLETRSYLLGDLLVVRLKNVLTPAEVKLTEVNDPQRGRYLLKQMRQQLIEHGRPRLDAIIHDVCGVRCVSLHTDISTKTGERIIVFTLERAPTVRPRGDRKPGTRSTRRMPASVAVDSPAASE